MPITWERLLTYEKPLEIGINEFILYIPIPFAQRFNMERIFIEAYSDRKRNEVIHELERKITENGGWIMDHQMFSNKSISFWVVTSQLKLEQIFNDLKGIELNMNPDRINSILLTFRSMENSENIILSLTINFINNYSDLDVKMPFNT